MLLRSLKVVNTFFDEFGHLPNNFLFSLSAISHHHSLFQANREQTRDAITHRDAIDDLGTGHGNTIVGDDDELRALGQAFQDIAEARYIGFVKRSINLVEQTEG